MSGSWTAVGLVVRGARALARSWTWTLPLAAAGGFGLAGVESLTFAVLKRAEQDPALGPLLGQVCGLLAAGLGLLLLLNLRRVVRERPPVQRAVAWAPVLALPAAVLGAVGLSLATPANLGSAALAGPIVPVFLAIAFTLPWSLFVGSALHVVWAAAGWAHASSATLGEVLSGRRDRLGGAVSSQAAATLAVWAGLQLLVPGIYYGVRLPFVGHQALLAAEERPFRTSTELSSGHRGRLFRLFVAVALVDLVLATAVTVGVESALPVGWGADDVVQALVTSATLHPAYAGLSWLSRGLAASVSVGLWGAVQAGLVGLWMERRSAKGLS